jgi:hypothetical protein
MHPERKAKVEKEHAWNSRKFHLELELMIASNVSADWRTRHHKDRSICKTCDDFCDFSYFPVAERRLADIALYDALFQIGNAFEFGTWLEPDSHWALQWYEAAAHGGSIRGLLSALAQLNDINIKTIDLQALVDFGETTIDAKTATKLLDEGCTCIRPDQYGSCPFCLTARACNTLHSIGISLMQHFESDLGEKCLKLAARLGNTDSREILDEPMEETFDVAPGLIKFANEVREMTLRVDPEGIDEIVQFLRNPTSEGKEPVEVYLFDSFDTYRNAIASGSCHARLKLACLLHFHICNIISIGTDEFARWLHDRASSGNPDAMFEYGLLLCLEEKAEEAEDLFRLAGQKRHPLAELLDAFKSFESGTDHGNKKFTRILSRHSVVRDPLATSFLQKLATPFKEKNGFDLRSVIEKNKRTPKMRFRPERQGFS